MSKSWRQHPTKHQLYRHLPPITKTIQIRRTRHAGHCWRSKDELISDVLLWTPSCGRAKAGQPARTYIQQLCEDTGCSPEDLTELMTNREKWRERVRDIRTGGRTWYIYIYICCVKLFSKIRWPSWLELQNIPTASPQRGKTPITIVLWPSRLEQQNKPTKSQHSGKTTLTSVLWPSWLVLQNTQTAPLQRGKTPGKR